MVALTAELFATEELEILCPIQVVISVTGGDVEEAQRLLTLAKIEAINSQIPSEEVRGAVDTYLKEQCI